MANRTAARSRTPLLLLVATIAILVLSLVVYTGRDGDHQSDSQSRDIASTSDKKATSQSNQSPTQQTTPQVSLPTPPITDADQQNPEPSSDESVYTVRILDEESRAPIEGARVILRSQPSLMLALVGETLVDTMSDADGVVTLKENPQKNLRRLSLEVQADGYASYRWYYLDSRQAASEILLPKGGSISGYVMDTAGNPVENASVSVTYYTSITTELFRAGMGKIPAASTMSKADGSFKLDGVPVDYFGRLRAFANGYTVGDTFDLIPIGSTNAEVVLGSASGTLEGRVVRNDQGLSGVKVIAVAPSAGNHRIDSLHTNSTVVYTSEDGSFNITNLPVGHVFLQAHANDEPRTVASFTLSSVPILNNEVNEVTISLPTERRIKVLTINAATQEPMASIKVSQRPNSWLYAVEDNPPAALTGFDGLTELTVYTDVDEMVILNVDTPTGYIAQSEYYNPEEGSVFYASLPDDGHLVIPIEESRVLRGRVVNKMDRSPIGSAVITTNSHGLESWAAATGSEQTASDSGGNFQFEISKQYLGVIYALKDGYSGHIDTQRISDDQSVIIEVYPTSRIQGRIVGPKGEPVGGVTVYLNKEVFGGEDGVGGSFFTSTLNDGSYAFDGVTIGDWNLSIHTGTTELYVGNHSQVITISESATVSLDDIVLERARTIRGIVIDSDGNPVAGASVHLSARSGVAGNIRPNSEHQEDYSSSDALGRFAISMMELPKETLVTVRVHDSRYFSYEQELKITGDDLEIILKPVSELRFIVKDAFTKKPITNFRYSVTPITHEGNVRRRSADYPTNVVVNDSDGAFYAPEISDPMYRLTVEELNETGRTTGATTQMDVYPILLAGAKTREAEIFLSSPIDLTIRAVFNDDGRQIPASNVKVYIYPNHGFVIPSNRNVDPGERRQIASTDADGRVVFENTMPGQYSISFQSTERGPNTNRVISFPEDDQATEYVFVLDQPATLFGRVVDEHGNGVTQVKVTLLKEENRFGGFEVLGASVEVGDDGRFELSGAKLGANKIMIQDTRGSNIINDITIDRDQETDHEFLYPRQIQLSGQIRVNGKPSTTELPPLKFEVSGPTFGKQISWTMDRRRVSSSYSVQITSGEVSAYSSSDFTRPPALVKTFAIPPDADRFTQDIDLWLLEAYAVLVFPGDGDLVGGTLEVRQSDGKMDVPVAGVSTLLRGLDKVPTTLTYRSRDGKWQGTSESFTPAPGDTPYITINVKPVEAP